MFFESPVWCSDIPWSCYRLYSIHIYIYISHTHTHTNVWDEKYLVIIWSELSYMKYLHRKMNILHSSKKYYHVQTEGIIFGHWHCDFVLNSFSNKYLGTLSVIVWSRLDNASILKSASGRLYGALHQPKSGGISLVDFCSVTFKSELRQTVRMTISLICYWDIRHK